MVRALVVAVALLVAAPVAQAGVFVDRAVKAFLTDERVYVDPGTRDLDRKHADLLRGHILATGGPPFYAAVLPPFADREVGGGPRKVADAIGARLSCRCTVVVVVGGRFAGLSSALPRGRDRELAAESLAAHGKDGVYSLVRDYDTRVAQAASAGMEDRTQRILAAALAAVVAAVVAWVVVRRRRQWEALGRERVAVEAELTALAARLGNGAEARTALARAQAALRDARKPRDLRRVERALAEARGTDGRNGG